MSGKRSQAGIEMMAVIGIVLIIFLFMSLFAYRINLTRHESAGTAGAEDECMLISAALTELQVLGSGAEFSRQISHNLSFSEGVVSAESGDAKAVCSMPVRITNMTNESFMISGSGLLARNMNGKVVASGK
ncbi:MAG: hypothetical protein R6U32_02820 [Candidatus Woesearchaeota archaeon]